MFETQNATRSAWERLGKLQSLVLLLCFVIATPIIVLVGFAPAIEGDFALVKVLVPLGAVGLLLQDFYPQSMFDLVVFGLSAMQFMFYGIVISFARHRWKATAMVLAAHVFLIGVAFIIGYLQGQ